LLSKQYEIEIEEKQFFRRIQELIDMSFPVVKTRGRYSTYYLNKTDLSPEEVLYIYSLIKAHRSISEQETERIICNLQNILPYSLRESDIHLDFLDYQNHPKAKIDNVKKFNIIFGAIKNNQKIRYKLAEIANNKYIFSEYKVIFPKNYMLNECSYIILGEDSVGKNISVKLEDMFNVEMFF
jgi:predicted DNA-binding transcriptional regulator YafY